MEVKDLYQGFISSSEKGFVMTIYDLRKQGHVWLYKQNMDAQFPFQIMTIFFQEVNTSGISLTNRHLLVLNEHKFHVIPKSIEQTWEFGLNMMILPSYTSHALQPLNVTCFKLFKRSFKKEK
jgi:hypothetical protein